MPCNWSVDADAQGRPVASLAPGLCASHFQRQIATKFRCRYFVLVAAAILSSGASCAGDIASYEVLRAGRPDFVKNHINGMGDGMSWINAAAVVRGDKPFYCEPALLSLTAENYMSLVDDELKRAPYPKDTEIGYVLLQALRRTLPCK